MRCAFCGYEDSRVLDSRPVEEGRSIRRRRECLECGKRFTTYERVEELPLIVVKKDNRREMFDSNKLLNGLIKACDKRAVPLQTLEEMISDIERELRNNLEREVASTVIGEMVMQRLRHVDQVAYVRFASVYRQFEDVATFVEEIRILQQELIRKRDEERAAREAAEREAAEEAAAAESETENETENEAE